MIGPDNFYIWNSQLKKKWIRFSSAIDLPFYQRSNGATLQKYSQCSDANFVVKGIHLIPVHNQPTSKKPCKHGSG